MMRFRALAALLPLLLLAACGDPSKADILKKAEKADTKDKLEKALGRPQDITKLGPLETWVYKAKDGQVTFTIAGDTVALQITQDKEKK